MATAAKAIITTGGPNSKTKRANVTTTMNTVTIPAKVQSAVFKNVGANDIRMRINASGANFWTLKPDETSPKIAVNSATIDMVSVGGNSTLECLFEG